MAFKGLLEGFNVGRRSYTYGANRTDDVNRLANLGFGYGSNVPADSDNARGGIYCVDNTPDTPAQIVQVTRDNSVNRGHHTGAVRVGFYLQDIEPPFDATPANHNDIYGSLFCYAQEVNDHPVGLAEATKPAPDPPAGVADKVEGFFELRFQVVNLDASLITLNLHCQSRLPSFGGGVLSFGAVDTPRSLSPGDFLGIEFAWESTNPPDSIGTDGHPKPTILLKGYTCVLEDFSDKKLWVAAQHDFDHPPVDEQDDWLKDQIVKWNVWGLGNVIRDPLLEGATLSTGNTHTYVWSYYEVLDGT